MCSHSVNLNKLVVCRQLMKTFCDWILAQKAHFYPQPFLYLTVIALVVFDS